MNKKIFFLIFFTLSFIDLYAYQNRYNSKNILKIKEKIEVRDNIPKLTQKYLDIFNQKNNAFILIHFFEKEFLEKEIWENSIFLTPDFKKERLGNEISYYWLIACEDIECRLGYYEGNEDIKKFKEQEKLLLKKGESLIIQVFDGYSYEIIKVKNLKDNSKILEKNLYYDMGFTSKEAHMWDIKKENSEENTDLLKKILKKSEIKLIDGKIKKKDYLFAIGQVDLDGDGKDEEIKFISDISFEEVKDKNIQIKKEDSVLGIDNNNFYLTDMRKKFEEDGRLYLTGRTLNIYILDLNPDDNFKELLLEKENISDSSNKYGIIYHYKDKNLIEIGELYYYPNTNIPENINILNKSIDISHKSMLSDIFYLKQVSYKMKNGKIIKDDKKISEIYSIYDNMRIIGVVDIPINIYINKTTNKILFKAEKGKELLFISTDSYSWIEVKDLKSGKKGYLHFTINKKGEVEFSDQKELKKQSLGSIFKFNR